MIKLYLYLTDLITPIFFGGIYNFFILKQEESINIYFYSFIFFSFTMILVSLFYNFYTNYYEKHFSEKIRISFITTFLAILFQLILYLYYELFLDRVLVILWINIAFVVLLARYVIKKYCKKINNTAINIIGTYYKFNDHEILMLTNKGFTLFFHNSFQEFNNSNKYKVYSESINVVNFNISKLAELKDFKNILMSSNCFFIDKFMEVYLRKIFISDRNIIIDINKYCQSDFILKRLVDYSAVIFFIPILLISFIFIFFIKMKHGISEAMLFVQKRYGLNNKIFNIYKIRTMVIDSKEKGNTKKNDSRIYPFALIVRKLRIDELPQIFNILFGDMHLVGPRAEWVNLADQYSKNIFNYNVRHIVRPGITGWAQIIYPYGTNEVDAQQKLMYDLYYIKHWSIWFEIEICIKTFMVILDKRGF